jgi:hypothetical protein
MTALKVPLTATADSSGSAVITLEPRGNVRWTVRQISVEMDAATGSTTGALRENGFLVAPFVPAADAIVEPPPMILDPGEAATVEWSGAPPGAVAQVLAYVEQEAM